MGIRTRRARKHSRTHAVSLTVLGILGFFLIVGVAVCVSLTALVDSWLQDLPDFTEAESYLVAEPTQVYDADGNNIASFYLQNRMSVEMEEVSEYVIEGTVATEDVRFYEHNGVDLQGIARAVVVTLQGGSEGASTITQQLVRNTVLADEQFEKTLKRKVREAYIALQMEKMYSKDQILMMYLNTIYYGHGAYGIEAASITYFNKHASELTLAEAATLAGLPQSPSYLDPFTNPEAAKERRNTVLDRMVSAGYITQEECDAAKAEDLVTNEGESVQEGDGEYPYWTSYIRSILLEDFDTSTVFQGGLQVYTTLDPDCQAAAEAAVEDTIGGDLGNDELDAALVAIDVDTGNILAMVGGRNFSEDQYNAAVQAKRQVGSSFKAFTLTAAIEQGMDPDILIDCSSPKEITSTWTVQNYANTSYGTITLRQATVCSSNTGYAQVAMEIGVENVVSMAHLLGIDEELPAYPSITLGTIGIPPLQMAEANATLASGGVHRDTCAITKITDRNGNLVYEHEDNATQVIDPSTAAATTEVLEEVVTSSNNGTVVYSNPFIEVDQPCAGKTGTTTDTRDLWFCGYTPQVAVAVWVGYREEQTITINGSDGHPYLAPCPIFFRYINSTLEGLAREEFPEADDPIYADNSSWSISKSSSSSSYEYTDEEIEDDEVVEEPTETTTTETTTTTDTPAATDTGGDAGGTTTDTGGDTGGDAGEGT